MQFIFGRIVLRKTQTSNLHINLKECMDKIIKSFDYIIIDKIGNYGRYAILIAKDKNHFHR